MQTGPMLNIQYAQAPKQFRGKKSICSLCISGKKTTFSTNLNTGNNRISCHFLQASLQLVCQCLEVCVWAWELVHMKLSPFVCVYKIHTCVVGECEYMPAFACRPPCVSVCVQEWTLELSRRVPKTKTATVPPSIPPFPHGTGLPGMNGGHGSRFRSSRRVLDGRGCLLQ